jgi:hypothetical protein
MSNPRITSAYLDSYVGRNVTVVGKVVQLRGDDAVIDADGNITAHLNRVCVRPIASLSVPNLDARKRICLQAMVPKSLAR